MRKNKKGSNAKRTPSQIRTTGESNPKQKYDKKRFETQMKIVFASFQISPKTMLMVEVETGIMRPNICRYVSSWKKCNSIDVINRKPCEISKAIAGYYTTNPELFPKSNQLNLFE